MLIAHVQFAVAASERQKALDVLVAEVSNVRAMAGCRVFLPFLDPTALGGLGVFHEWESEKHFAAYLSSQSFAAAGQALRPMMIGTPVSRRFDARLLSTVN